MKNLGIRLSWISVKDLKAALKFYVETVGFTLMVESPEHGWAELQGPSGSRLGIAQECEYAEVKSGSNTVTCVSVENIEEACAFFQKKGARLIGKTKEIEGHVKIQTFADPDGNIMQLVQEL